MAGAGGEDRVAIGGWEVRALRGGMTSTAAEEELSAALGIKLPGMVFASSGLILERPASGLRLSFRARDALAQVGPADPSVRVRAAAAWAGKEARTDVPVGTLDAPSDWTFTTKYAGTLSGAPPAEGAAGGIDYDALRDTSAPIRFFAAVPLFEDELDDNGVASYSVRIRCMPDCLFVLARFFLRVDGVLVRVLDTRFFHRYSAPYLVRETSRRECAHAALPPGALQVLTDADRVAALLPVTESAVAHFAC